jgi:carbonic anhydrase
MSRRRPENDLFAQLLARDGQWPSRSGEEELVACPECTYRNHADSETCEQCGAELPLAAWPAASPGPNTQTSTENAEPSSDSPGKPVWQPESEADFKRRAEELARANTRYSVLLSSPKRKLRADPKRRLAIVTCIDCRFDPARALGLEEGDAHVIRNAGATVTGDVIRSLLVSVFVRGVAEIRVIGHQECGMAGLDEAALKAKITAATGADASEVKFLPQESVAVGVRTGVQRISGYPLFPKELRVSGWIYDPATGRIEPID